MTTQHLGMFQKSCLPALVATLALCGVAAADTQPHKLVYHVNCATAEGDLRALNAEKTHTEEQQLEDVTALIPAGALIGLVSGTEQKKLKMLSSNYITIIDNRIAETKAKCNL